MTNADQIAFWTEEAGPKWVRNQAPADTLLAPVLDLVLDRAGLTPGQSVLDIGCGAGASTRAAAALVAPDGRALGADVSATLLASARAQGGADYIEADAQVHDFGTAAFDAAISRFGVMFFADSDTAFANIRKALRPGANLTFAAWGAAPENAFFMTPAAVARAHFGPSPKSDRSLPGPFAFEDPARIEGILTRSGWRKVQVREVRLTLDALDLDQLADLCTAIGPAEAAMRHFGGTEDDRRALRAGVRAAFAETGGKVAALINLARATA